MSAGKTFRVTGRIGFRYEAQFANLFNVENKGIPNTNVASGSFGAIRRASSYSRRTRARFR